MAAGFGDGYQSAPCPPDCAMCRKIAEDMEAERLRIEEKYRDFVPQEVKDRPWRT